MIKPRIYQKDLDILGKAPSLDDYEGTWDDANGLDRDDTYLDLDAALNYWEGRWDRTSEYR